MSWTAERVETLQKLWADGLSCSQIAKQLGGVTRNAVIGKISRLGLSGSRAPASPPPSARRTRPTSPVQTRAVGAPVTGSNGGWRSGAKALPPPPPPTFVEPAATAGLTPLSEEDRPRHFCRWPIGDPLSPDFAYCGREQGFLTDSGRRDPYCPAHRAAERARASKPRTNVTKLVSWVESREGRPARRVAVNEGPAPLDL